MREQYLQSTGQAPAPEEPDGDDDGDDDRDHQGPHRPGEKPHGNGHGGPPGNPGGGDGGPPGGGDDPSNDGYEGFPRNRPSIPHRGYTMPPVGCTRLRSPGVQVVLEHHHSQMHLRLIRLCRQRLDFQIRIPDGTKLHRVDTNSVGSYSGSPKFKDLELWLTHLVVLLQASQYGGLDRDLEQVVCIPEFLMGEANLWYCRHVVHINRLQEDWTFEQVITGLYDWFVHLTTMQEARDAYYTACYSAQLSVQGFYDTLCDHAQNMSVYPDAYNLMDTFLRMVCPRRCGLKC
jgi:hypothetical protein